MPSGIHHVTSIASSARRNLDFYTGTLGLRLVKKTVNFDDPGSYHLYYGDAAGHPGTILTFFPWEGAPPGRLGIGEAQETVFSVPEGSIGYWTQRLIEKGVDHDPPAKRFGETTLAFKDRDGTRLALAGVKGAEEAPGWSARGSAARNTAIRGFHSVSLLLAEAGPTAAILTDVFGFVADGGEGVTQRYRAPGVEVGGLVDLRTAGEFSGGAPGRGLGSPHRVSGGRRRGASGDGRQARPGSSSAHDRAEGPQLFPLGLFPRARPGAVRNRHRSARFRRRRAAWIRLGGRSNCRRSSRASAPQSKPRCRSSTSRGPSLAIPAAAETPDDACARLYPSLRARRRPDLPPVLLLHGTGGDETDLLPLGREIAPHAALLSPRGNVLEGDMPRFFRRYREGLFDEDDVRRRANELAISSPRRAARIGLAEPVALGYSNGANIAAAVLLLHPKTLAGAILLRATTPLVEPPRPDLSGIPVLILSGLERSRHSPLRRREAEARARRGRGAGRARRTARRPWPDAGRRRARQGVLRARSGACVPPQGLSRCSGLPSQSQPPWRRI